MLERECCAFASWSVRSTDHSVVLDITATSDEAVAAVQGMFGSLRSAPPSAERHAPALSV